MANNVLLFFKQFVRDPRAISSVIPSSPSLGRLMASAISDKTGQIAELGPGTGSVTRQLLAAGIAPNNLHLFEINDSFVDNLRISFPGVTVHNRPAQDMVDLGLSNLSAVISSLPLLSIPVEIQRDIVAAAFKVLKPGGLYVQFTYGNKPSVPKPLRDEFGLSVEHVGKTWCNVPPANVHIFRREADFTLASNG